MAIKTFTNSPYFDDFDSTKNYLRILFRPGRSVQVRELNQLQSSLQDQIDKFGRHVFKDGDRVLDGYTSYDPNIRSIGITLEGSPTGVTDDEIKELIGKEVYKSGDANLKAKIVGVEDGDVSNSYRLFLKYSGTGTASEFANTDELNLLDTGDTITVGDDDTEYVPDSHIATCSSSADTSSTYWGGAFQDSGVFFVKGHFVYTDAQQAFYVKTSSTKVSGLVVFDIADGTDQIVTSGTDESLLDNANGEPNVNAPGADRYVIELTLNFVSANAQVSADQQRVNLLNVVEDSVIIPARTQYSELGKTLAQRTEEESGSYTLKPFKYDLREYLNENGNRGRYLSGDSPQSYTDSVARGKYILSVEPSTAYVQGYRVEFENKLDIEADKGRSDTGSKSEYKLSASRGMYIEGSFTDDNSPNAGLDADLDNFIFAPNKTYTLFRSATASSDVIGTCRIQSIENTGSQTGSTTKRIYIYDLVLTAGESLSDAQILQVDNTDSTDSDNDTYFHNTDGFTLYGIGENDSRMVYPLGGYTVKQISTAPGSESSYVVLKKFATGGSGYSYSSGTVTLDASALSPAGTFASSNTQDYVILQEGVSTDSIVARTVTLQNAGAEAVIELANADGTTAIGSGDIVVFAKVEVDATLREKHYTTGSTTEFDSGILAPGDILELDHIDVDSITSIVFDSTDDITSDFTLISGQEDTHYGKSKILYKGTQSYTLATGDELVVTYNNWEWQSSGNFFGANSYKVSNDGGSTWVNADLEDIPSYEDLKLSNCLDFRPSITDTNIGVGIVPNSIITTYFDFYKPRKDIVVLNQLGEIKVISGTPGDNTSYPETPSDSLLLYQIDKPGYVYSINDIDVQRVDNTRYTMGDIGDLDARIKKLEYHTALSQLEREAAQIQLQDSNGERFKNGIITDSFRGHGVGDTMSQGYKVAIDSGEFAARSTYLSDNVRWGYVYASDSNVTELSPYTDTNAILSDTVTTWNGIGVDETPRFSGKRKNAVTLDYIEKTLVSQPYASNHISVNPYDVPTWTGSLEISPSSDEWKDVKNVPDIIQNVEGNNSALLQQIANDPNILGTEWNEWETQWKGVRVRRGRWWRRRWRTIQVADTFTETTWETRRRGTQKTFERQLRDGIQTSIAENFEREVIDDRLLSITFVPFIRSRKIYFKADMLKPNTRFYLYFDDVNISSYAKGASTNLFSQFGGAEGSANASGDVTRYDGQTSIDGADQTSIVTNSAGHVEGWVVIPNNSTLRFKTGTRQIRLTDSSSNNRALELSSAESTYFAKGILETRQRTILSTRQLVLERTQVSQSRNLLVSEKTVYRDPVAQTFMIGNEPAGIFLSSVDLYFQAVDPYLPIEMSIVSVENGIPTQNVVPFSRVIKNTTEINIDATNAQDATNFKFDTPIYLQPGVEYAILLVSNSARYRVWHSEVGETNKVSSGNAEKITKNPYLGVLLKSQNASTWTPDQNKDLKFKLNRADFYTDSDQTAYFTGLSPQRSELTYIDVTAGGSGYLTGAPQLTITSTESPEPTAATAKAYVGKGGVIDYVEVTSNGGEYTDVSAITITAADPGKIYIDPAGVELNFDGNNSGFITLPDTVMEMAEGQEFVYYNGGGANIVNLDGGATPETYVAQPVEEVSTGVYKDVPYGRLIKVLSSISGNPITMSAGNSTGTAAQYIIPTSATLTLTPKLDTWKATSYLPIIQEMLLPEANALYTLEVDGTNDYGIIPNELLYTNTRVTHDSDSGWNPANAVDTLKLTATLSTSNSKISPVIDLDRLSLVTFDNIINNSSELETQRDDGQCAARYITKKTKLASPADQINVYLDVMRPDSSSSIEVYAKFRYLDTNDSFDALPWERIDNSDTKEIPVNTNFEFSEINFQKGTTSEFTELAIKVLFKSSSSNKLTPEIKNLRVIASV